MTTQFRHFRDHKLFMGIFFYKNILCFEGASSSCRVANLKLPSILQKADVVCVSKVHDFQVDLGSEFKK